MNFSKSKTVFSLINFIIVWMKSCYSKEFCEEFRKNGNKIDFVFRRMAFDKKFFNRYGSSADKQTDLRTLHLGWLRYKPVFDLFIDGHYWRVRMDDPLISLSLTFLDRNRGRNGSFFKGYRMGADIPNGNHNRYANCITVLFSNSSVKFGNIPNSRGRTDLYFGNYKEWLPIGWTHNSLAFPQNQRLDFAFTPIPDLPNNIDFATKSLSNPTISGNPVNYRLTFSRYTLRNGFNQNADQFIPNPIPNDEYSIFKNWTTPYNIIGVTTMPDTWLDLTLMILMADEERVLFCLTLHNFTSDYCRDPVELVNCGSIKTTSTVPSTATVKTTSTPAGTATTNTLKSVVPSSATNDTKTSSPYSSSTDFKTTTSSEVIYTTITPDTEFTFNIEDILKYWKQITLGLIIFVIIVIIVSVIVFRYNPSVFYIGPPEDSQTDI